MKAATKVLAAAVLGAGAMFLMDPDGGRRRRALVRDKVASASSRVNGAASVRARHVVNRTRGMLAGARALFRRQRISDGQLAEHVRSTIGFVVRHPRSIDVRVRHGRVVLCGPVLADEVDRLLTAVGSIGGVAAIENRLDVHSDPGSVPGVRAPVP